MGTNSGQEPNSQNKGSNEQDRNNKKIWPFSSKETFVGVVTVLIIVCWVGLPIWSATQFIRDGSTSTADAWTPLLSVFVALTTLTVSAIFLFMTFRIDRGVKFEAQSTAEKAINKIKTGVETHINKVKKGAEDHIKRTITNAKKNVETHMNEVKKKAKDDMDRAITDAKNDVEEDINKAIREAGKDAKEAKEKIMNRIDQLTDDAVNKRIETRLQNRDIDVLELIIRKAEEEVRKQRTDRDNDQHDG